jgi:iron(III) transport system permease protein
LLDAGRALGLTPWRSFLRISLPMARPAIAAGAALALDGDARRLRHRGVLRRADVHHRDLSRLVLARRSHRSGAAVDRMLAFVFMVLAIERISRGQARFAVLGPRRLLPREFA